MKTSFFLYAIRVSNELGNEDKNIKQTGSHILAVQWVTWVVLQNPRACYVYIKYSLLLSLPNEDPTGFGLPPFFFFFFNQICSKPSLKDIITLTYHVYVFIFHRDPELYIHYLYKSKWRDSNICIRLTNEMKTLPIQTISKNMHNEWTI